MADSGGEIVWFAIERERERLRQFTLEQVNRRRQGFAQTLRGLFHARASAPMDNDERGLRRATVKSQPIDTLKSVATHSPVSAAMVKITRQARLSSSRAMILVRLPLKPALSRLLMARSRDMAVIWGLQS
jgi:hypothetical protein